MPANLSPELLAQILALRNADPARTAMQQANGDGSMGNFWSGMEGTPLAGYTLSDLPASVGGGAAIYGDSYGGSEFGQQGSQVWNAQTGDYMGTNSGDGDGLTLAKLVAAALATYAGGYGLENMGTAGATAGTTSGTTAAGGAGLSGFDAAMADLAASGGLTGADLAAAGAGTSGMAGAAGAAGGASGTAGTAGAATTAAQTLGQGMNWGNALGAVAGAASARDQTQATNRAPWAPAQPFLQQQITQGQQLANRYQQQPFSPAQQTAYGNYGGLLDAINSNAGGLLGGMNASASGANNFDRSNPRKPLQPGGGINLSQWLPGLLGNLGTGGR